MALTSTRVAVEFFRIQSVGGASLSSVIARPTTNRITSVAEHGFVDLPDKVEAVPQVSTGYGVLLLDATDQAGVSESFGWQIGLVGEYGSLTLVVPSAPSGGRTVTVGGTSYPAVWLTDLADFSAADGSLPLSSFFTKSEVDAKFAALPFRSDNTTLTGAAIDDVLTFTGVSPVSFGKKTLTDALRPSLNARQERAVMAAPANVAGHPWTNTGTTGTVDLNNTEAPLWGSQSVKMTTNGADASTCHVSAPVTLDMTDRDPVLWVKVDDVSKLRSLEIRFGTSDLSSFFFFEAESNFTASRVDRYLLSGKWHRLTLPWGAAGASSGTPVRGAIGSVRVTPHDYGTGAVSVWVAAFGSQPQPVEYPNGVCCFTFDDGWLTQYTVARPILDRYGFPATALPIVDLLGQSSYMSTANLRELQDEHGWEIAAHAYTAAAHNAVGGITSLTADQLDAELRLNKKWLLDNGFTGPGRDVHAYPQGIYNDDVIAATRKYYGASRSQHSFRRDTLPPAEPFRVRTMNLGSTVTLATTKAAVDEAVANREFLIFTLHQLISPATTGSHWTPTDFADLVAYVAQKNMAVRTLGAALGRADRTDAGTKGTPNPQPGQYFIPVSATLTVTANNLGTGNLRLAPWRVNRTLTLSALAAEITTAGDAGGKLRLGIYADNGSGYPGALVVDAGQIAADAVATAEATFTPVTLQPGIYWLGGVVQSVTTTQPVVRACGGNYDLPVQIALGTALPAAGQTVLGVGTGGGVVTGALPASYPAAGFLSGTAARLVVKAA